MDSGTASVGSSLKHYIIIDFNEVDIYYLPEKVISLLRLDKALYYITSMNFLLFCSEINSVS